MKPNKLIILISIAIILTLAMVLVVREDQHNKTIVEYLDREIQKEQGRLETYGEFVKDYNEFQDSYRELYEKYNERYIYWQNFTVTAYTQNDDGCNNIVATNFNLDLARVNNLPIIATDPEIIPLYSIIEIKDMGAYISLDVGGAIRGNRIDILFNSKEEAIDFGIQEREVRVIK